MPRQDYTVPDQPMFPMFQTGSSGSNLHGIEILRGISSLLVKHRGSVAEAVLGFPSRAKYDIFNDRNEQILFAYEESTCCQRYWCAVARRFTLHIVNSNKEEIMRVHRDFTCCAGCCWCSYCDGCRQNVTIEAPPGNVIGTVSQGGSCWRMNYILSDANGRTNFTVLGPCCICDGPCCCCCENKFAILGNDGQSEIGAIHKLYAGYCKEAFTSADNFSMDVPMDLDVRMKAVVLGSLFVIDFTNFAMTPQQQDN